MYSWPTDDRQLDNSRRKTKGKGKEKENDNNYPHFQQGLLTALTLLENNGRLEWTSLVNKHVKENLVAKGKFVKIFPVTRPPPPPVTQNIVQRAEEGAHFLRTYFPDVDITAELIRDEVVADAKFSRKLDAFDPYMGNLLEPICCPTGSSKQAAFLAFPMGDLNADLNVSPFVYKKAKHSTFKPLGTPSQTFPTPIRQILSSSPLVETEQSSHLAVRTFGSTSFFEIKATVPSSSSPSARLIDIAKVVSSDVGNRPLVDVKFSTPELGGILVNDHGAVYVCSFVEGRKTFQLVYAAPTVTTEDLFWRVVPSEHSHGCILASYKHVHQVDFRTNNSALDLLSIRRSGELVTSIDTYRPDHLVHLTTTSEILWIDDRFPRKPLLGTKHGRQFDRYLEIKTVPMQKTPLTFLTSRRNGLVTVYDVCRSKGNLLHINAQPYSPQAIIGPDTPYLGYSFFRHPSDSSDSHIGLFTMSERGSIHRLELEIPTGSEKTPPRDDSHVYEWLKDVEDLNMKANDPPSDFELVDARVVNLDSAYDKIFLADAEDTDRGVETAPENVYEVLDRIPFFWQESNGHLEHMVTLFDIAFRSGEEPNHPSRADFLTQCALNSTRGYRALVQGRVLPAQLIRQAPWHHRISPILKHFDADMSEDTQVTVDHLRRYDLADHPDQTEHSLRRESEAREQLALDLALSMDVFSPQPISKPAVDVIESMSRATEALSLADEPPAIHFGYLRPVQKRAVNRSTHPDCDGSSDELTSPMGVRLLLKEWEIGTDPRDYIYKDPYDDTVADGLPPRRTREVNPLVANSQRPPSVVASSIPQAMLGRSKTAVYSTRGLGKKRHGKKRVDGF